MCIDGMIVCLVLVFCVWSDVNFGEMYCLTGLHQVNVGVMWRKEMCW
jgi:hypothetical protein